MAISLRNVTAENWEDCIELTVADSQRSFVASNLYSLAESKFETSFVPLAIYDEEQMVGFLMYGCDPDDGKYWLVRLMVDQDKQGKGFGKQAVKELLKILQPKTHEVYVGYKPENVGAQKLYGSVGFRETGEFMYGENIAVLKF
jgi:diamine N-acetyltransferase